MLVREIKVSDADKLSCLISEVEASSEFMLWEAGEREVDQEKQESLIKWIENSNNSTILVAENTEKELVGYLFAFGGDARRNRHSAYLVVGISEKYRGRGIGTALFTMLDKWAKQKKIHRLELTVVTENRAGVSLYQKMGFEIEGTKKHSLLIGEAYVDEYYMSKLLGSHSLRKKDME